MDKQVMSLPKTFGDEKTDTRAKLEELGFNIFSDKPELSYEVLAPEGWTTEWNGQNGAVYNQNHEAVIWLWRKTDFWEPVYTMRMHA